MSPTPLFVIIGNPENMNSANFVGQEAFSKSWFYEVNRKIKFM